MNKKRTRILVCLGLLISTVISAQEFKRDSIVTPKWTIIPYGFIRTDIFTNSRQEITVRPAIDGAFNLYPAAPLYDANNNDINAAGSLNFTAIFTRLGFNIIGPRVFGAKSTGFIEGEFTGITSSSIGSSSNIGNAGYEGLFRLRHAFAKLDWAKTQLGVGQYWHPLFQPDCSSGIINLSGGAPFQPFARVPQVRLTHIFKGGFTGVLVATSQNESSNSNGPASNIAGGASVGAPFFMYQSMVPNLNAQIRYENKKILLGFGYDYKVLRPALRDTSAGKSYVDKTTIASSTFQVFGKLTTKPIIVKMVYTSGKNLSDQTMIGGYAAYLSNAATKTYAYDAIKTSAFWFDVTTRGRASFGLFAGYMKNHGTGTSDNAYTVIYGRGMGLPTTTGRFGTLDHVVSITPRFEVISNKFKFAFEASVTKALYGAANKDMTVNVSSTTSPSASVTNTMLLFVTQYIF